MTTLTATTDILTARDYRKAAQSRLTGRKGMTNLEKATALDEARLLVEGAIAAINTKVSGPITAKAQDSARAYRKEASRLLIGRKGMTEEEQAKRLMLALSNITLAYTAQCAETVEA